MKKKNLGKCSICGKEGKMTFEHIPPYGAFNRQEAKTITGDSFLDLVSSSDRMPWDVEGLRYLSQQKGTGLYSLCSSCNNFTGAKYVPEYNRVVNAFVSFLLNGQDLESSDSFKGTLTDFYPQRFVKQVLSMFCSTTSGLTIRFPIIKEVLLDEKKSIENPEFNIYMFIMKNQRTYWSDINALAIVGREKPLVISEINAFPFGFVLDYNSSSAPEFERLLNITSFLTYGYDDKVQINMYIPLYKRVMPFPVDFRTKEQVEEVIEKNKRNNTSSKDE